MRTINCEHPKCTKLADYKAVIIHMMDNENYVHKYLCAQHYAEEKARSTRWQYNIAESIPDDLTFDDDEAVQY